MSKTLAERMQDGVIATDAIETRLFEASGEVLDDFTIGTDYYDNSLEIYISDSQTKEFLANTEFAAAVFEMGFSRFWVNWPDKSEQYCYLGHVGARLVKSEQ